MEKKIATEGSSNRVSLGLKCGTCVFFNSGLKRFEQPCHLLGQESFSAACPEYSPDMRPIMQVKTMDIEALAAITSRMSQQQLQIMAYVFRNMDFIRKSGLAFGQPVVFSIDGQDYLENYFSAVVVGASKDGRTIYLTSSLEGLNKGQCMLTMMRSSLKTLDEFAEHHGKLLGKGRLRAPSNPWSERKTILQMLRMPKGEAKAYMESMQTRDHTYQPLNIDVVPQHWLDSRMLENSIKKKGRDPEKVSDKTPEGRTPKGKPGRKVIKINRYQDTQGAE